VLIAFKDTADPTAHDRTDDSGSSRVGLEEAAGSKTKLTGNGAEATSEGNRCDKRLSSRKSSCASRGSREVTSRTELIPAKSPGNLIALGSLLPCLLPAGIMVCLSLRYG